MTPSRTAAASAVVNRASTVNTLPFHTTRSAGGAAGAAGRMAAAPAARARNVHPVRPIVRPHSGRGSSVTASVFGEDERGPSRRVRQGPDADLFEVDD